MEPGFFLDLAENTGDGFAYVILPVKDVKDIPLGHNSTTLTRCVVQAIDLNCLDVPICQEEHDGFHFYKFSGKEIFGSEELSARNLDPVESEIDDIEMDLNQLPRTAST